MGVRSDPFQCPQCGNDRFEIERQITVWQTLTINAVCPQGHYGVQHDEVGETAEEHAIKSATCTQCGTDIPVSELLPWTANPEAAA